MADLKGRFLAKITKAESGCWLWCAAVNKSGYGILKNNGKTCIASRVSWELFKGALPVGRVLVMHTCDNPRCVNPCHLFLGTDADNCADRDKKGRQAKGVKHGSAKLTEDHVKLVRKLSSLGYSAREISQKMPASVSAIRDIRAGRTWQFIMGE